MHRPFRGTKSQASQDRREPARDPRVATFGGAACAVRASWGLPVQAAAVATPRKASRGILAFAAVALLLMAVTLTVVLLMQRSTASSGYTLDTETFADESLLAIVAVYDTDGDGRLSPTEAASVTELDCSDAGLRVLAGIELFTNLEVLDASGNDLAAIDLSLLKNLREVNLSNNRILDLSLADHESLVYLNVEDNGMVALDLSGCPGLQTLLCAGNGIARLDLAGCTALTELVCDATQNVTVPLSEGFFPDPGLRSALAAVDTDGDGALSLRERQSATSLSVTDPQTSSLYGVAWLEGLLELNLSGTQVGALSAAELPAGLTTLRATGCQIALADLGGLDRLATLDLSGNPLVSIDLSGLPRLTTADLSDCRLEGTLVLNDNPHLEHLDATGNPRLAAIDARGVAGLAAPDAVACDAGCVLELADPEPSSQEAAAPEAEAPAEGEQA